MNDVLRIARLKIALQRAFLRRAILRVIHFLSDIMGMIYKAFQVGDMASEYFINIC